MRLVVCGHTPLLAFGDGDHTWVRGTVKTDLFYSNDTIIVFLSQLIKIKTTLKLIWPLLMLNWIILDLIWLTVLFVVEHAYILIELTFNYIMFGFWHLWIIIYSLNSTQVWKWLVLCHDTRSIQNWFQIRSVLKPLISLWSGKWGKRYKDNRIPQSLSARKIQLMWSQKISKK